MGKLAITGGEPLRKIPFPPWPMSTKEESLALEDVLSSSKWGGQPFPGKHASMFAKKFARSSHRKIRSVREYRHRRHSGLAYRRRHSAGGRSDRPAYTWEGTVGPVLL